MSREGISREVEVKLEAPSAAVLEHIGRLRALGPYALRPRGAARLHTTYLDTPQYALARAGVALRVRRAGREWEVSAKWAGRSDGPLHERPELTVPLAEAPPAPFRLPPGLLHDQLRAVVLGRPLRPILVSAVHRVRRDVVSADARPGPSLAELALDAVTLQRPDGPPVVPPYCEVEIEARTGSAEDLAAVAALLRARYALVPSSASKFARGFAAVAPQIHWRAPPPIAAADTSASAVRAIVGAQLQELRHHDGGTRRGYPEALHKERVALRHLRATVRTFGFAMPPRLRATLPDELRWLARELGQVRDLDVQHANLTARCRQLDPDLRRHLRPFQRFLRRQRHARRAQLAEAMTSRRYDRLLLALERFAMSPPPKILRGDAARPIAQTARTAIERALRRLVRTGDAIGAMPKPDELHALRIRAKRLRYVLDAVTPLTGRPGRKLAAEIARLQDVLGGFHDAVVASHAVRAYRDAEGATTSPVVHRVLSEAADDELRRAGMAQAEFAQAWQRFTDKKRRRHARRLLKRLKKVPTP